MSTRAERKLRAQVIAEEPLCWLQLDGCTTISDTIDHIIPRSVNPALVLERTNCRGACQSCNNKRGHMLINEISTNQKPTALAYFDV